MRWRLILRSIETEQLKHYYTDERNEQIVIALLKTRGIRKVIANP